MKKDLLKYILTAFLIMTCSLIYCQKEYNNWYFGNYAGMTFNSGSPVALTNSAMRTGEACASISDSSGQLLFYTDGRTVYNRNHQILPNGNNLFGSYHATQGALIIQKPLCKRYYYIFTVSNNVSSYGANYSVVDIAADNGLGDIIVKNELLLTPCTEKLTAIRHKNGVDIWIIIHAWESNAFYSYLLTKDGIIKTPVISTIGSISVGFGSFCGCLKPNSKGTMIAAANYRINFFELFKFAKSNGYLNYSLKIGTNDSTSNLGYFYGIEFSPDGNFFYGKTDNDSLLYQYNISQFDSSAINNSKTPVGKVRVLQMPNKYQIGALQTGPDKKIYIANTFTSFLSCIRNPNEQGVLCNFLDSAVDLQNKQCVAGLPNNPFTAPYIQYDGCYAGTYSFHLTDTTSYQRWDFGDPQQGGDTAIQANPSYTYTQPGVYTVTTVYLTDWQTFDTVTTTVYAYPMPGLIDKDTLFICTQDSIKILADSAYDIYQWSQGGDTNFIWVKQGGKYFITATEYCGCSVMDSITVVFTQPVSLGPDTSFCREEEISLEPDITASSYLWSTGSVNPYIMVNQAGTYWLEVKDGDCIRRDTIEVGQITISLDIGEDTIICEGQDLEIRAEGDFTSIQWGNGSTGNIYHATQSGWVSAMASKAQCKVTDSLYLKPCSKISFPNVFTPNGDQRNDLFIPDYEGIDQYKLIIFNRWGHEVFSSNDPATGWDGKFKGQYCPQGVYFFTASYQILDNTGLREMTTSGGVTLLR